MHLSNEKLNKAAVVLTKIIEVFHWVAVGLLSASLIVYFLNDNLLKYLMDVGNGEFAVSGYSVNVLSESGDFDCRSICSGTDGRNNRMRTDSYDFPQYLPDF